MKIRDLIHDMETLESDNIVITKVTHAQDCNNKKLPKKMKKRFFSKISKIKSYLTHFFEL